MKDLSREFLNLLSKKPLLVAIGNPLRGDDGAGIFLLDRLQGKIEARFLDGGTSPENYLAQIVHLAPAVVVFLDAVDLDEPPGTMRLLIPSELAGAAGVGTHGLSPRLAFDYLQSELKDVSIFILGIQPKNCRLGEGLSEEVKAAIEAFVKEITAEG